MSTSSSGFLSVVYGLASAASWGAGDFCGGVATKRTTVYSVMIVSQLVGSIALLTLTFVTADTAPPIESLLFGGLAGISGALGLVALYSGLATRQMGVVAPVAAVVAATLPVAVGIFNEGLPPVQQLIGFGVALIAVWFLSQGRGDAPTRTQDLKLPVAAGVGFGLFFIMIDRASGDSVVWPLIAARFVSVALFCVIATVRRQAIVPARSLLPVIMVAGLFDTGGNAFFALATRVGRLDVSALLSSLYPVVTVLLAWLILRERLLRQQWFGVGAAVLALVLIAL